MSSSDSPTLNLDVRARRGERAIALLAILFATAATASWQQSLPLVASVATFVALGIAAGFVAIGWLGGKQRLSRIACDGDGHWRLTDGEGRITQGRLTGSSRVASHAIWLQWSGLGRTLLLLPGDIPSAEFRRLVVRLRLLAAARSDGLDHES